jgi:hypothetical protein
MREKECLGWLLQAGYIEVAGRKLHQQQGLLFSPASQESGLFPLETVDLPLSLWLLKMETVAKSINFYEDVAAFRLRRARHTQLSICHHTKSNAPQDSCLKRRNV